MSDPEDIERAHEEHGGLSRRTDAAPRDAGRLGDAAPGRPGRRPGAQAGGAPDRQAGRARRSSPIPPSSRSASRRRRSSPSWSRPASCPPVEQRIGQDPLVVKPLREIGKYGGTWRRGFTGPFDTSNGHRAAQNDKLLYFDYTGTKIVPNIARGWEVSPDGKVTTLLLRRGMKWSDGQPFTADDFVFWFEDVYQNKELVPTPLPVMTINGKPIAIQKVDAATVQFVAPDPYYALPIVLASVWGIGHHARFGRDALGGFAPAHYLKQFHPEVRVARPRSTRRSPRSSSTAG